MDDIIALGNGEGGTIEVCLALWDECTASTGGTAKGPYVAKTD